MAPSWRNLAALEVAGAKVARDFRRECADLEALLASAETVVWRQVRVTACGLGPGSALRAGSHTRHEHSPT